MPTSAEKVRRGQAALADLARREVSAVWPRVAALSADRVAPVMSEVLMAVADKYGPAAGAIAADYYDELRVSAGADGRFTPTVAPLPDQGRFEALARWGAAPLFGANPDPAKALSLMGGGLSRVVQNVGRETIAEAVASDPAGPRYARHASANACAFCAMLATRGAVYTSSTNAGRVTGEKLGGTDYRKMRRTGVTRESVLAGSRAATIARGGRKGRDTSQALGDRYHDDCHCTVVPVFPGQRYDEAPYVKKWREAYANAPSSSDPQVVLASMREELGTN